MTETFYSDPAGESPDRSRLAASRNRVLRGRGAIPAATRTQQSVQAATAVVGQARRDQKIDRDPVSSIDPPALAGRMSPPADVLFEPGTPQPLRQGPVAAVVGHEPDTEVRDTEQIPLLEEGGIEAFLEREVLPCAPDAWYQADSVKVAYEIGFNRYFDKPAPMRTLGETRADILAVENETEGLLDEILRMSGTDR